MEAEAANGNSAASNFDLKVLKDPKALVKVFKLMSPRNRFKILRNMSQEDLKYLMQFMDKKDLVTGLNYFTKDKLVNLMYELPKEKISKCLFSKFSPKKFLKMIPEREINYFFESSKLDKNEIIKEVQNLEPDALQGLMENITGQPQNPNSAPDAKEVGKTLQSLSPQKFKKAIQSMDRKHKSQIILALTEKHPDLFCEFSKDALMFPLKQLEKPELVKTTSVLEQEDLVEMVSELPEDLMAVVVTQLDPEKLAEVLCDRFQDVLQDIGSLG